jgi:hypothetical protein
MSALGAFIGRQRPYGNAVDVSIGFQLDNTAPISYDPPNPPESKDNRNSIDIFGPLAKNNADNLYPVHARQESGKLMIPLVEGAITLKLGDGVEYDITKGLRIPWTYKTEEGEVVYSNIFVLFNGSGQL